MLRSTKFVLTHKNLLLDKNTSQTLGGFLAFNLIILIKSGIYNELTSPNIF